MEVVQRVGQTAWDAAGACLGKLRVEGADAPWGQAELTWHLDVAGRPVVSRIAVELGDGRREWAELREGQTAWEAAGGFLDGLGGVDGAPQRAVLVDLLDAADPRPVVARALVAHKDGWAPVVQRQGVFAWRVASSISERTGIGPDKVLGPPRVYPSELAPRLGRLCAGVSRISDLSSAYGPFIWDVEYPTWYTVVRTDEAAGPDVVQPPLGTITLSKRHIEGLAGDRGLVGHHLIHLREAASDPAAMVAALRREDDRPPRLPRVAHFEDVWASPTGWIVDRKRCENAVRNGGPVDRVSWNPPETARELDDVITTTTRWSSSPFHFAMESMVGLTVPGLDTSTAWIHVSEKNEFVHEWLEMTLGVPASRVVDGVILAKRLHVPEMARHASPSALELARLQGSLRLPPRSREARDVERTVLLMRRNFRRPLKDADEVERIVRAFADRIGARLVHHDDRSLPSVPEQLDAFRRASVIVGPHGAAELNLIAADPGACVVEISPPASDVSVLLYPRISALLGLHHWTVASVDGALDRPEELAKALDECYGRHIGALSAMG